MCAVVVQEFTPERPKGEPQDPRSLLPMVAISMERERYRPEREDLWLAKEERSPRRGRREKDRPRIQSPPVAIFPV